MPNLYWDGHGYDKKLVIEFTDGSYAILHSQSCGIGMREEEIALFKDRRASEVIRLMHKYSYKLKREY